MRSYWFIRFSYTVVGGAQGVGAFAAPVLAELRRHFDNAFAVDLHPVIWLARRRLAADGAFADFRLDGFDEIGPKTFASAAAEDALFRFGETFKTPPAVAAALDNARRLFIQGDHFGGYREVCIARDAEHDAEQRFEPEDRSPVVANLHDEIAALLTLAGISLHPKLEAGMKLVGPDVSLKILEVDSGVLVETPESAKGGVGVDVWYEDECDLVADFFAVDDLSGRRWRLTPDA